MIERIAIIFIVLSGVGLIYLSGSNKDPTIIYNRTDSAPIGWYYLTPESEYETGDLVAAWLPEDVKEIAYRRKYLPPNAPIIKTVFAEPGDHFCIKQPHLRLADGSEFEILSVDRFGRKLPAQRDGCRRLSDGQFLLISDRIAGSFDSRYFGPVEVSNIVGRAGFLGEAGATLGRPSWEKGGARGSGAEGKIKEACTKSLVNPCLHIDFGCTKIFGLALRQTKIGDICCSSRLHQSASLRNSTQFSALINR